MSRSEENRKRKGGKEGKGAHAFCGSGKKYACPLPAPSPITLRGGLSARYDRHRRIARWALCGAM